MKKWSTPEVTELDITATAGNNGNNKDKGRADLAPGQNNLIPALFLQNS